MSLNCEMAKYTELTGEDGTKVSISRLGGYLDGYEKGRADERERIVEWCKEQSRILKKQSEDFNDEECFGGYIAFEAMIRHLEIVRGGEND